MTKYISQLSLFIFVLALTSCFQQLESPGTQASIGKYLTSDDFTGADSAVNLTTGIQINWSPVNPAKNILGYKVYRYSLGSKTLLASLDPNSTSYIDGSVVSGSKYQYIVRAVDPSEDEDANNTIVSAIAWSGLTSVESTENDSITVNFDSRLQGYYLRISLEDNQVSKTTVVTLSTPTQLSQGTYKITSWTAGSIKPGANYNVYAQILDPATGSSDGNNLAYAVSTNSYGFHNGGDTNTPGWNNVATVRAFGRSPGTQTVTNLSTSFTTPVSQTDFVPTSDAHVDIGFLPFTLPSGYSTSLYRYTVFRFEEDDVFDTSDPNIASCPSIYTETSPSSLEPCIVKDNINPKDIANGGDLVNGVFHIIDRSVWENNPTLSSNKPPRYRYTMVVKHLNTANGSAGYREYLPTADIKKFSVLIPIPPKNMVLVSREAANYEFCTVQKAVKADPLNFNRCSNAEVGSIPLNSNPGNSDLNLTSGYYDFGYNLFVDRYPLACNNNLSAEITNGADTTISSFNSMWDINGRPGTPAGTTGDVLYAVHTASNPNYSSCQYFSSDTSTWLQPNQFDSQLGIVAATAAYNTALTSDPQSSNNFGKAKFSYLKWTAESAMSACSSFAGDGYGPKRIPRLREFRAFNAQPFSVLLGNTVVRDLYYNEISAATAATASTWDTGSCVSGSITTRLTTNSTGSNITSGGTDPSNAFDSTGNNYTNNRIVDITQLTRRFMIGSKHTAACMSRYGVADVLETTTMASRAVSGDITTAWYPTSDLFAWFPTTSTGSLDGVMKGIVSGLDSGNVDGSYDIGGTQTGYRMTVPASGMPNGVFTTSMSNRFNISLGLPVLSTQQGTNSYAQNRTTAQNYGFSNLTFFPRSATSSFYALAAARYSLSFGENTKANSLTYASQVRCVLPAD